ncbi:MAG: ABC transporter ATP-binding protein [Geminicoccaceae bacterium]
MSALLAAEGVTAGYGSVTVLRHVSLHLDKGETIGLFGPNGHGKTTLLRCLSGLLRPATGRITFDGGEITMRAPHEIVAAGLVHAPQGNVLFGDMMVGETLELAAFTPRARLQKDEALAEVFGLFPRLDDRRRQQAKTLSGGERQMLSIGAALMCAPRVLMLDEPTLGLSPKLKAELSEAIARIAETGTPMIVVEQDVEFLLRAADRLYFIEQGEVVRTIDRAEMLDHAEIMELYFGVQGS